MLESQKLAKVASSERASLSFSFDGFWQSVKAYELQVCIRCEERAAVDEHGCCGCCHWKVEAEVGEGWPELRSYLAKWAAFGDWERP